MNYFAVDLGATSGRTILASFDGKKIEMKEITRFENPMIPSGGHLYWDIAGLYNEVLKGLRAIAAEGIAMEINYTRDVINSVVGQTPTMVRPPYGAANELVQSVAEAPLMFWSVDTLDWELKDAGLIRDYVLNNVKDGDIVLMHDIYEATVQAAIELIPILQERGFQIVTVSEMARARGITLENGAKYYNFYK